jgi:hypothetical protein
MASCESPTNIWLGDPKYVSLIVLAIKMVRLKVGGAR